VEPEFNNGPIAFRLGSRDAEAWVWSGSVDLDSKLIASVSPDAGYFLFCHASYLSDPCCGGNPEVANPISNRARREMRILERP